MTPDEFIAGLRAFVIDANATHYDEFYSTFPPARADTPFLQGVVKLYADLSPEQRDVLAQLLRKVAVDAVGNTLGVIDRSKVGLWSGFLPFPDDLAVRFFEAEEADEEAATVANEP